MPRLFLCPAYLVVLILSLASEGRATTVARMDLTTLTRTADAIVHGEVVGTASRWNADHTLIVTDVRFRVDEALKGSAGGEIVLAHPGGVVGALRVEIPGLSSFHRGQESVLFLSRGPDGARTVTALGQGRFDVSVDPDTGRRLVQVPSALTSAETSDPRQPLQAFLERIRVETRSAEAELDR